MGAELPGGATDSGPGGKFTPKPVGRGGGTLSMFVRTVRIGRLRPTTKRGICAGLGFPGVKTTSIVGKPERVKGAIWINHTEGDGGRESSKGLPSGGVKPVLSPAGGGNEQRVGPCPPAGRPK